MKKEGVDRGRKAVEERGESWRKKGPQSSNQKG